MKKNFLAKGVVLGATAVLASGCFGQVKPTIVYWSPFGSALTTTLDLLLEDYNEGRDYQVKNESQHSYIDIKKNIEGSIGTLTYPNFANGYPDHFASYISQNIQIPLDYFIESYNGANGGNLVDDYFEEYMKENLTLKYKEDGSSYVMGLPFNKSTELLGYNGYMFDFVKLVDSTVTKLPETYAEWKTVGPKIYNAVVNNLAGKKFYGVIGADDHLTAYEAVAAGGSPTLAGAKLIYDMKDVAAENFTVLSWDALDNMFITLVRQFGGQYTSYTSADAAVGHGWATFWDEGDLRAATRAAMEMVVELHDANVFKMPLETSDKSFASNNFKQYKTFSMVCSSGGLSNNIDGDVVRLRLAPIPYASANAKYVISQGTNLGLFDQGTEEDMRRSFETMVALSTGEMQAKWAVATGYYPASKSAYNSEIYQDLIKASTEDMSPLERAYQESAKLNSETYMVPATGWFKFVDPGFVGSSEIRSASGTIIPEILKDGAEIDKVMSKVLNTIEAYVHK